MEEETADEGDLVWEKFRHDMKRFKEYIAYLETIPEAKRTIKQNEMVREHGSGKKPETAKL
jgi:hypothetical protein